MSQPLRIRKALAEVKSMDGGVDCLETRGGGRETSTDHARQMRNQGLPEGRTADTRGRALPDGGSALAGVAPGPSTLLTGREYIPANQHTGASGLRSFLDRQIARGLKPREHKDYFSGPNF
jgi:hypothetical protein